MNDFLSYVGIKVGWTFMAFGSALTWLADHGMGIFGVALGLFGAWIQWMTYRLREREAERKESLDAVLRPEPVVASQAQSLRDSVQATTAQPLGADLTPPKGPDYST